MLLRVHYVILYKLLTDTNNIETGLRASNPEVLIPVNKCIKPKTEIEISSLKEEGLIF